MFSLFPAHLKRLRLEIICVGQKTAISIEFDEVMSPNGELSKSNGFLGSICEKTKVIFIIYVAKGLSIDVDKTQFYRTNMLSCDLSKKRTLTKRCFINRTSSKKI